MKFQDKVKSYMAIYKENTLGVTESGRWKRNNQLYRHILPEEKQTENLLPHFRGELSEYILQKNIHLHNDFHHLNSSQAACLNFFYPMIADNQLQFLLELLQLENEVAIDWAFEKIIPGADGTNFDFYLRLESGREIFFEIKYTEDGFGKASDIPKYQQKYESVYKERLAGKLRKDILEYSALIQNYQLLRNISYVDSRRDDQLIIICPRDNVKLHKEYEDVMDNIVDPGLHEKIRLITWESLLIGLKYKMEYASTNVSIKFAEHYAMFERKYSLAEV